ncbi:MAG: Hsp33 family molecular chaperone HslO [Oscillospiraceae bacterium]|jgi:molecular chaperone Hsp33|nr:Hsp33 family molecular chaperone HslO [Oscillospiraceae bacterium]
MRTDRLLHITLMAGAARALLCDVTRAAETARRIHRASRVCAAALGRGISGAAVLNAPRKGERLTLTFNGGGPAGALTIVSGPGVLKASIGDPSVELPLKPNGKLDVGGAIGREGRVIAVRDMGMKQPYIGQSALVSGEIAEDLAMYCTASEQQPTLCALGVRIGADGSASGAESVLAAGGLMIQPLPGCPEELLSALELRRELFADISAAIESESLESLAREFFGGLDPEILQEDSLEYRCDCGRDRMERALVAMGRGEIASMIEDQGGAELTCHFCGSAYSFTADQLGKLLALSKKS